MKSDHKPVDFSQHVSLQVKTLKILGVWLYLPSSKLSIRFWLHVLVRIVYAIFVFIIPPILQIAYVVKLMGSDVLDIEKIASSINLILTELTVSTKLLYAFVHRGLLMNIIDQLATGDFYRTTHRNVLENTIKSSRRIFWILLIPCATDVLFHMVVGPALAKFRTLPVKMELIFFNADEPPSVYYVCFYQIIYKVPIVIIFVTLQTIAWSLLSFTMTQLDLLMKDFKNMEGLAKETMVKKNCSRDDAYLDVFERFVLRHRVIIKFVNSIESTFGGQFAITLLLCSGITCFTGVQFLSIESPTKNVVGVLWIMAYLVIFVLVMYIDCFYGNSVYVKSTELATVAYESPWLEMPQELKKNLVLFIARAQKPLAITAYNLVTISLPTFTTVKLQKRKSECTSCSTSLTMVATSPLLHELLDPYLLLVVT